jgi:NitT/TauT family transport system permease protein
LKQMLQLFEPNRLIDKKAMRLLILGQIAFVVVVWAFSKTVFLPKPGEILASLSDLWNNEGLGGELVTSFLLNLQALLLSTVLSLGLAYAAVIPFFRPAIAFLGKMRFLSLAGLSFFFTLMASNGHELKLYLLVFSVSVFFLTGMADVVDSVPKERFDLARTLRMGEWRVVYEVIILGQADKAFDTLRQNAAMGWLMLTLVETISREGGGIGTLLMDQNKHFHLSAVFAIQLCILAIGVGQDYAIGAFKQLVCPYASLTLERK